MEISDKRIDYILEVQHMLMEAGHAPFFASKSLVDLSLDANRVSRLVEATEADAWIVVAGSKPVLDWFACQNFPTFTLFGGSA